MSYAPALTDEPGSCILHQSNFQNSIVAVPSEKSPLKAPTFLCYPQIQPMLCKFAKELGHTFFICIGQAKHLDLAQNKNALSVLHQMWCEKSMEFI
jgi:hypothetical protein